jgi:hypothetical protein
MDREPMVVVKVTYSEARLLCDMLDEYVDRKPLSYLLQHGGLAMREKVCRAIFECNRRWTHPAAVWWRRVLGRTPTGRTVCK